MSEVQVYNGLEQMSVSAAVCVSHVVSGSIAGHKQHEGGPDRS